MANFEKRTDKELLANNLTYFRKSMNFTQQEIASKFNYSDKAVSKWERGESAPDIFVLKALSDFYGVPLTDFFKEKPRKPITRRKQNLKHLIITLLSIGIVWLVATIVFVLLGLVHIKDCWLSFIIAIPLSFILGIIFSSLWGNKLITLFMVSGLMWTATLAIYLPCEMYTNGAHMFLLWVIPIPLQIMAVLFWLLKCTELFKRISNKEKKPKKEIPEQVEK